ncbi:MAG: threonylcarbamoyl-AMP synthase [Candidatus Mariimomonas ferrooxydans]
MLRLSLYKNSLAEVIHEALQVLKNGGIVAYPTESFYGLGVMANDRTAVEHLYRLKKRPLEKAMPLIVGNTDVLNALVKSIPPQAEALIKKFWPCPLTLIFESRGIQPQLSDGNRDRVAVRIPGESFALDLAKAADFPVTATSANPSGEQPAQEPAEVIDYFGENIDLLVDGGKAPGGKPSTIVDVTVSVPKVLREGSILLNPESR